MKATATRSPRDRKKRSPDQEDGTFQVICVFQRKNRSSARITNSNFNARMFLSSRSVCSELWQKSHDRLIVM